MRDKWDNFYHSFDGFDPVKVANYGSDDINRLFNDEGIIRNRRKILATSDNATTMLELIATHGSFHDYLRSLDHLDYYAKVETLTGQFSWLGRTSAFVFLHCVNEETPGWAARQLVGSQRSVLLKESRPLDGRRRSA